MANLFQGDNQSGYVNPKQVKYSNILPVGTPAQASMVKFRPSNGSVYTYTGNNTIQIPISYNGFLDAENSYLQFTVTNGTTTAGGAARNMRPQHSAYSFFSDFNLRAPSGELIDSVAQFPALMALLGDVHLEDGYKEGVAGRMAGYSGSVYLGSNTNLIYYTGVGAVAGGQTAGATTIRSKKDSNTQNPVIEAGATMTFIIPMTGFLAAQKYLPLHAISRGGGGTALTLELTLANPDLVCGTPVFTTDHNIATGAYLDASRVIDMAANVPNYSISNVSYEAQVVQFSSTFESMFDQVMQNGGVSIQSQGWNHQRIPLTAGLASISVPISARYKSIKSLVIVFRSNDNLNGETGNQKIGARNNAQISSYQFRIGEKLVPSNKIDVSATNYGQCLVELLKAFGYKANGIGSRGAGLGGDSFYYQDAAFTEFTDAIISADTGIAGAATNTVPAKVGKFAIGIDLESYIGNDLESGLNTKDFATPIYFEGTLAGNILANGLVMDIYTLYDQIVNISPQGISVAK